MFVSPIFSSPASASLARGDRSTRGLKLYRLRSLSVFIRLGLEGYPHAVRQSGDTGLLDRCDMDENILFTVVGGDEAIAF
jgi:hypothetical protein